MSFIRPLSRKASANKTAVSRMLRVDHAGEIAARQIYNGQLLIFRNTSVGKVISHMAAQEQKHLDEFDKLIRLRRVRPTALLPVWSAAGYALGLGTALLGRRAAMACTVAVEEVIADHYGAQVRELEQRGGEPDLCHVFKEFRNDELEHKHTGLEHEAEQAPFYRALTAVIQTGCRAAISITERV